MAQIHTLIYDFDLSKKNKHEFIEKFVTCLESMNLLNKPIF
jgi:hypothetical protein